MRNTLLSIAAAWLAIAAAPPACAQSGAWTPPAVGTTVQWSYGGRPASIRIAGVSGYMITEEYGDRQRRDKYFGFIATQTLNGVPLQLGVDKLQNFFPLEVGKTAQFDARAIKGFSFHTLEVLGYEPVTVPAGTFDAFVIDWKQKGASQTLFTGAVRVWFVPAVGVVKTTRRVDGGPDAGREITDELVAVRPP